MNTGMIPTRKPDYQFSIAGQCIPKKRPRFSMAKGSKKPHVYMPPEYVKYKNWAAAVASKHIIAMTKSDVALQVEFGFEDRKVRDVDNLAGSIMDALNGIAYADDTQVTTLLSSKHIYYFYCEAAGKDVPMPASTRVRLWILGEGE